MSVRESYAFDGHTPTPFAQVLICSFLKTDINDITTTAFSKRTCILIIMLSFLQSWQKQRTISVVFVFKWTCLLNGSMRLLPSKTHTDVCQTFYLNYLSIDNVLNVISSDNGVHSATIDIPVLKTKNVSCCELVHWNASLCSLISTNIYRDTFFICPGCLTVIWLNLIG